MLPEQAIDVFTRSLFDPDSVNKQLLHEALRDMGVSFDVYIKLMFQVQAEIALYKLKLSH